MRALALAFVVAVASQATAADEVPMSVKTMQPVAVKTTPQAGTTDVDPAIKEIQVTFSKDMMTEGMWSWVQVSKDEFPDTTDKAHYLADKRTCVLPVKLKPGKTYVVWINRGRYNSFRDTESRPAVPYLLVFETKAAAP